MKKWVIILLVIAVIGVGGYFGWQRFQQREAQSLTSYQTTALQRGELTAVVGATGTVKANQTATIAWQISGRIDKIEVSLDDLVDQDQVLAELAQDSLPQSLILAEADLISARKTLENLLFSDVARAQAQQALTQAQEALEQAQNRRESKEYQRASDITVDSARASYILAQDAVDKAQKFYDQFANFPETDVNRAAALSQLSAAVQQRDRALAQLNWLLGMPDALELQGADASLAVAQANLKAAEREWERLKDGPDPDEVRAAEIRIQAIENSLRSVNLRAPFGGTITEMYTKAGDLVTAGTSSFRIDDLTRLLVDVRVPEVDINRISPGQDARISFDAIQGQEFTGKVTEVGRVGNVSQTGVDFVVTIELLDSDRLVRPGMTAAVNIVVSQLEDVLLMPNRAVRLRDGMRVVFLIREGVLTQVEIAIGAVSDTYSEVVGGDVREGDLVVLNPPAADLLNSGPPFMR